MIAQVKYPDGETVELEFINTGKFWENIIPLERDLCVGTEITWPALVGGYPVKVHTRRAEGNSFL